MKKALALAKKGLGYTNPNPPVGAVLVKNNQIIGTGFHAGAGADHAEIMAFKDAGSKAKNATLYVTLEPCSTYGKTPPCTDTIIQNKIKKVIIATPDPNPLHTNRGIKILKNHKIQIETGLLQDQANLIIQPFRKFIQQKTPLVILKIASSLDGKICTSTGESKWITSLKSRKYVHQLRKESDAILVGINTVLKDDPSLTTRLVKGSNPLRVILDSKLRIPLQSKVLKNKNVLIITTSKSSPAKRQKLKKLGYNLLVHSPKISLKKLLHELAQKNIMQLLVEGGSQVFTSFLEQKLADQLILILAPKLIGGKKALTAFEGNGITLLSRALKLKKLQIKKSGEDTILEYRI